MIEIRRITFVPVIRIKNVTWVFFSSICIDCLMMMFMWLLRLKLRMRVVLLLWWVWVFFLILIGWVFLSRFNVRMWIVWFSRRLLKMIVIRFWLQFDVLSVAMKNVRVHVFSILTLFLLNHSVRFFFRIYSCSAIFRRLMSFGFFLFFPHIMISIDS